VPLMSFLLIFLVAAKAKGISFFKNLSELNQKESPRLKWGSKNSKFNGY
jgi:3-phosphoshikimate 1-carboxyvinyltransferase